MVSTRAQFQVLTVEWIAGLAATAAIVWLMVKNKIFRYVVLGVVAASVAGVWAWYEKLQADERHAYALISPADIEFRNAHLSTGPGGKITVAIKNNDVHPLTSVETTIRIFDCPKGQFSAARCEPIGQETVWFGTPIPAGQVRAGDRCTSLYNLPPLRGELQWDYKIERVRAATP